MTKWVELEQHTGINLATKRTEGYEQWFVYLCEDIDGEQYRDRVGLLGWKKDAKLMYTSKVDPLTREFIEQEVAELVRSGKALDVLMAPELPPEQRTRLDELDEEDFAS